MTAQVEKELQERYKGMGHDVNERYEYEEKKLKDKARYAEQMQKYEEDLLTYKITGAKAPIKPMLRVRHPPEVANTTIYKYRRDLAMGLPPEFVPMSVHYAKLSHVDPHGLTILPEDAVGGEALSEEEDSDASDKENDEDDQENDEDDK